MTGLFFDLRSKAPDVFRTAVEHQFPEPTLQKSPQNDLRRFEREQRAALSGYGWVDRSNGWSGSRSRKRCGTSPPAATMRIIRSIRRRSKSDPAASNAGHPDGVRP